MSLTNQKIPFPHVSPVAQPVTRAVPSAATGSGGGEAPVGPEYLLRLNFVQPSYSLTDTSITDPRLRLNFVQDTSYELQLNFEWGWYLLQESGSDGFYIVRN